MHVHLRSHGGLDDGLVERQNEILNLVRVIGPSINSSSNSL